MTTLLLIRHAENDYVKKGRLAGWTPGVHLNDNGRQQAEAIVDRLKSVKLDAIYSSPLERAMETAAPLARARRLPIVKRPDLGEVQYGQWTGKSLKVLNRTRLWPVVQNRPSLMRFPEGESFLEVQLRATRELQRLCALHPKGAIAAVSHADVIKLAVAHFLGMHLDLFQRLHVHPASVTVLHVDERHAVLVKLNDTGPVPG